MTILVNMFMQLGCSEKTESDVDKILGGWRYLGWPTPVIEEKNTLGLCGIDNAHWCI